MKKSKSIDKSVVASINYEITETKIKNGIVYLKIYETPNKSFLGAYKWVKYSSAKEDSAELKWQNER